MKAIDSLKISSIQSTSICRIIPLMRQFHVDAGGVGAAPGARLDEESFERWWRVAVASGRGIVFAVARGDEIVGAAGGLVAPSPFHGRTEMTGAFTYVLQRERKGGKVGEMLLTSLLSWGNERGAEAAYFSVLDALDGELVGRWYRAHGMKPVGKVWCLDWRG